VERLKRHAIELTFGLAIGGVVSALAAGALALRGVGTGPWVWWLGAAIGIAVALWYGERIQGAKHT
jgi:hypothetical protein